MKNCGLTSERVILPKRNKIYIMYNMCQLYFLLFYLIGRIDSENEYQRAAERHRRRAMNVLRHMAATISNSLIRYGSMKYTGHSLYSKPCSHVRELTPWGKKQWQDKHHFTCIWMGIDRTKASTCTLWVVCYPGLLHGMH